MTIGLVLKNIFQVKCCFLCEQRSVRGAGVEKVIRCNLTEKRLSPSEETKTTGIPEWCPKKRQALIKGGKK